MTYPDGRIDRYDLDPLGRIATLSLEAPGQARLTGALAPGATLAAYEYRGPDRVARRDLPAPRVATALDYDATGRLTSVIHTRGRTQLAAVRWVLDAADRRRVVWGAPRPLQPGRMDYDRIGRLTRAALGIATVEPVPAPTQAQADTMIAAVQNAAAQRTLSWELDRSDTRSRARTETATMTIDDVYDVGLMHEVRRLSRTGPGAGAWPFQYDLDGRCVADDLYQYSYDALGRLVEARPLAGGPVALVQQFDPVGRVVRRTEATGTFEQLLFGLRVIQRYDSTGKATLQTAYGLGVDEVVMESDGSNRFPLQDGASSSLAYVDAAGNVIERYAFDPFGEVRIFAPDGVTARPASAIGGIVRYGGHQHLAVGRYDARARVYDPRLGRFLQPDPAGLADSPNLYIYAHHDPIDFADPTGEAAVLIGLLVVAAVGLVMGAGTDAIRQGIQIHERARNEFSWGELGFSAGLGAIAAPILVVAPELAVPLSGLGVIGGVEQWREGHPLTGTFDIATSLLPFAFKGARTATFGEGSLFAASQLSEVASVSQRAGRFSTIGIGTIALADRIWNQRFFRGTTGWEAMSAEAENAIDLANLVTRQRLAAAKGLRGLGLYFTQEAGSPNVEGTAAYWADVYGGGQFTGRGGPAILRVSVPRWRLFFLSRQPGVRVNVPQEGFTHPSTFESFFPVSGPETGPPTGPAAELNAVGRWQIHDPTVPEPQIEGLWPATMGPEVAQLPSIFLRKPEPAAK
jgi:RHS repeat-associated protein